MEPVEVCEPVCISGCVLVRTLPPMASGGERGTVGAGQPRRGPVLFSAQATNFAETGSRPLPEIPQRLADPTPVNGNIRFATVCFLSGAGVFH